VEEQVRLAVEKYITGVKARDARIVQDAFQENGMMWGYLGNKYTEMTAADFAAHVVATAPEPDPNYSAKVHSVQVTGEIATAILDERHYLGADFRNYFGLVRTDGIWRIASKMFTTVSDAQG
jgi:hypothetical protein